MKYTFLKIFMIASVYTNFTQAQDCIQQFNMMKQKFYTRYQIQGRRLITEKVNSNLSPSDHLELKTLTTNFKNIPHDTPEHQNQRIAMQNRAKEITRATVARSGYKLLNPSVGSPYDAQIEENFSADGYTESIVEVRSLLILKDAFPHVTVWMTRLSPPQNPWQIISIGITSDSSNDYVSWRPADGNRKSDYVDIFIRTLLPADCQ